MSEEKGLSEREQEILRLVATGASNKQIAQQLVISTNTVKVHLRNIFAKISVVSRTEATLYAIREGLVQVGEARVEEAEAEEAATEPTEKAPEAIALGGPATAETTEEAAPLLETAPAWWAWARNRRLALGAAVIVAVLSLAVGAVALSRPADTPGTPPPTALPLAGPLSPVPLPSRWRERAPMPTARSGLAVAAYEGRVYAIGGETAEGPTAVTERYDPVGDTWATLSPKSVAVADVAAAVVGGRVYVPGGRLASGVVTSVLEVYDPRQERWEQRAPLPVALSAYALVAFEGRLYLFGGWDGKGYVAAAYEYDPGQDAWRARKPMPTARGFACTGVGDGGVFVLGGNDGQRDLTVNEEYVPSRDDGAGTPWVTKAAMPEPRAGCAAAVAANLVHVLGGATQATDGLKYNVRLDTWEGFEGPPAGPRSRLGVALLDTLLYVVGGWQDGHVATNEQYQAIFTIVVPVR